LGWGTFFAALLTFGFSLLLIPFYPKRYIICGGEKLNIHPPPAEEAVKKCPACAEKNKKDNTMNLEEIVATKLQQLPEDERQQLLVMIDEWLEQHRTTDTRDIQQALASVQSTWATVTLDQKTLRWVAEDKELEYELD
jgi:hypothetical protein